MVKEQYITATNLAKIRIADSVIRDLFPDGKIVTTDGLKQVLLILDDWRQRLEAKV